MKGSQYVLMNKDTQVMSFALVKTAGITSYESVSILGKLPLDLKNISEWISKRFVIMDRRRKEYNLWAYQRKMYMTV